MRAWLASGGTWVEYAAHYGVSTVTVSSWARRYGVRAPRRGMVVRYPSPDAATLATVYAETGTVARMAQRLGVPKHRAYYWLQQANVARRLRGHRAPQRAGLAPASASQSLRDRYPSPQI
jgi:transposase-like protein